MKCPKCNSENQDGLKFCGMCGAPLDGQSASTETDTTPSDEPPVASNTPTPPVQKQRGMPVFDSLWVIGGVLGLIGMFSPNNLISIILMIIGIIMLIVSGIGLVKTKTVKAVFIFLLSFVFSLMLAAFINSALSKKDKTEETDIDAEIDAAVSSIMDSIEEDITNTNTTTRPTSVTTTEATTTTTPQRKSSFEITDTCVKIKDGHYFAAVEITNTGDTCLYNSKNNSFDFEDNNKEYLMTSRNFTITAIPELIAPGEKGYLYCSDMIDDGCSTKNGFNIVTDNIYCWEIEEEASGYDDFEVSSVKVKKDKYLSGVRITGRLKNHTNEKCTFELGAILYNKKNKIIGAVHDWSFTVEAGQSKGFELSDLCTMYMNTKAKDVDHYVLFARDTHAWLELNESLGEKLYASNNNT